MLMSFFVSWRRSLLIYLSRTKHKRVELMAASQLRDFQSPTELIIAT
jgi:hypothetical protein